MSWPIQIDCLVADAVLVVSNDLFELVDAWVKNVTIQGEAVRGTLRIGLNCTTEPKQIDLLICIVELQNSTDLINNLQVLVLLHIPVME